jgi:hypothetical protein
MMLTTKRQRACRSRAEAWRELNPKCPLLAGSLQHVTSSPRAYAFTLTRPLLPD